MANNDNLRPWPKGQSGNPKGKPKGTRHISSIIKEMLETHNFTYDINGKIRKGTASEAIVASVILRAIKGDLKAFDLLAKYGYENKLDNTVTDIARPVPILYGFSSSENGFNN